MYQRTVGAHCHLHLNILRIFKPFRYHHYPFNTCRGNSGIYLPRTSLGSYLHWRSHRRAQSVIFGSSFYGIHQVIASIKSSRRRSASSSGTMPDLIESVAHGILVQTLFADNADADWKLQNIWADATTAEMSAAPEGSRAREGHVYPLDNTSTIKRGDIKSQNPVWPPMWSSDAMSAAESSLSRASEFLEARSRHPCTP